MIRIDSMTQSTSSGPVRTTNDSSPFSFADMLAEQIVQVAEVDKSKQPLAADNQLKGSENTHTANPRDELERLLSMSPFELIRYQILQQMGMTEETLKELPFEERMKIEEKIKEQIERQLGVKTGEEDTAPKIL